ncbi:unnamed protein product [Diamesa serratosioi]
MLVTMCIESQETRTLITKYTIHKGNFKLIEGSMDSCDKVAKADKNFKKVLADMNWPTSCPVKANGYDLKIRSVKPCVQNSVIRIADNITASITQDCQMHLNYCLEVRQFNTCLAKYTAVKNGIKFIDGEMDSCDKAANGSKDFKSVMKSMGIAIGCPVADYKACNGTRIVNLRPWKRFFLLISGAPVTYHIVFDHNTGKSCFDLILEFVKSKN